MQLKEIRVAVGYECNLRCAHCYSVESSQGQPATSPRNARMLTLMDYEQLLETLRADLGLKALSITGGEPFYLALARTTLGLVKIARRLGIHVRISTNGMFLTPDLCVHLAEIKPESSKLLLQVSLDGATGETHDQHRQFAGAFAAAVDGIRSAVRADLRVQVRYTLSKQNLHECLSCVELCQDLGVETVVVKPVVPTGIGPRQAELAPSDRELEEVNRSLRTWIGREPMQLRMAPLKGGVAEDDCPGDSARPCDCGTSSLHLTPYGELFPCGYLAGVEPLVRWCLGSVLDSRQDLSSLWRESPVLAGFLALSGQTLCPGATINQMAMKGEV